MNLFEERLLNEVLIPEKMDHDIPYISGPDEIPNEEYHRSPKYSAFISSSGLKNFLVSPKHAKYYKEHPRPSTPAMAFGSFYHDLLAAIANTGTTEAVKDIWRVFEPPINPKTNEPFGKYTKAYAETLADQGRGVNLIDSEDEILAKAMINELLHGDELISHEIRWLLDIGQAEQSHFVEYLGHGFKYRTDLKTEGKIIDWKTTTEEFPKVDKFPQVITKYHYDISAAMYQFFEHEITGIWKPFYWVVQEKEPPHSFTILDSKEWTWEIRQDRGEQIIIPKIGGLLFLKLMDQYIHCIEKDFWPGYSIFIKPDFRGHRIGVPEVPGWYKGQMGDLTFYNK